MSNTNGLLAAFESGELLRPSADALNVVDLASGIAGLAGFHRRPTTSGAAAIADLIGPSDHLVIVVADGLGMNVVSSMGDGAFIAGHLVAELRTVFPSSTPVVMTSLATGAWPCDHAIPGWDVYLSEIDVVATIIQYVRRSDEKDLSKLGMDRSEAFPLPSAVGDFDRDVVSYLPEPIANTPFSTYTSGGTPHQPYKKLEDAVDSIGSRASRSATPTITQLYVPDVDHATHEFGTRSPQVRATIERLDRAMERLARALPAGARLVMTADHGLVDFDQGQVLEVEPSDPLIGYLVREPWGTGRVANFQVSPGKAREFERLFSGRYGEFFYLITVEEAGALELYGPGPLSPAMNRRVGTHLAISRGPWLLEYKYPATKKEKFTMVAQHSGLTPEEMLVPLVVA